METSVLSSTSSTDKLDRLGKVVHTRSRRGCLTCRSRHTKCDERVPKCGSCKRLGHDCQWGLKLSFNGSRVTHLSEHDSSTLRSIESLRSVPRQYNFVNEASHVAHGENPIHSSPLNTSNISTSPRRSRHAYKSIQVISPSVTEDEETVLSEPELLHKEPAFNSEYHDLTLTNPNPSSLYITPISDHSNDPPEPESSYTARPTFTGLSYTGVPHFITDNSVKSRLISCYFKNVSRWCELTDSLQTFTAVHGRLVVQSRCFGPAALALSAKFLDNTEDLQGTTNLSSQLYEHARLLLREEFHSQSSPTCNGASFRLTAVVLSLYCAMTLQAEELRTQLRSYIDALQLHTWEDPPTLTSIACFWAMARLDIWAAYQCRQPTLIQEELWSKFSSADTNNLQDHWAHRAMVLFSRIINQVSRSQCAPDVLQELWEALQSWVIERPECMQPVLELEIKEGDAVPVILFSNYSAVCGNIFYHTGCILLLETSRLQPFPRALGTISNPVCHARRVGAISISNDQNQWINNIEPIGIAARHYMKAEEQILILKHLKEIRTSTGWETAQKARSLRVHWGLE